jgi:hypothetical protein
LRGGMGPPITYLIDGKQYISLMGGQGTVVARNVEAAATGAAANAAPATPATPPVLPKLLTFVLDGKGTLPATAP